MIARYVLLVILFFGTFLCVAFPTSASEIDLLDSSTWNIRIDGSASGNRAGLFYKDMTNDLDGNGENDLVVCEYTADNNSRSNSGSCYLIYDSILSSMTGTGNTLDLADSSNWNIRFDGAAGDGLGYVGITSSDLNDNGSLDLVITAGPADYVRFRSGSVYVLFDDIFSAVSGTGNTIDLSNSANYTMRYDGGTSPCQLGESFVAAEDLNDNGVDDLILASGHCGIAGRSRSGALYIIYDDLVNSYDGTGNNIDLATESNYNLVYYEANSSYFTISNDLVLKDINNNGKLDIVSGITNGDYNSRTDSGSVVVIYDSLIDDYVGTGNEIDLTNTANFNIRFDGAGEYDYFGWGGVAAEDIDDNGEYDLVLSSNSTDNNSRNDSGSLYIIYDSLLGAYSGTGNIVDMANSSSWNIRYDGATSSSYFGGYISDSMKDINNNGRADLIIPAYGSDFNSRNNSGSVYVIYDDLFDGYSGTGNTIDISNSSNYSQRYDSANAGDGLGFMIHQADVNNDSSDDMIFSAYSAAPYGRSSAGSIYIVYNFPHSIVETGVTRVSDTVTLSGTISASDSSSNIGGAQYQISMSNPTGDWQSCSADDGAFDSNTESFTCVVSSAPVQEGSHTIYVRSSSSLSVFTPQANYEAFQYSISSSGAIQLTTNSQPALPQIPSNGGGVFEAITNKDYFARPLIIMSPYTTSFESKFTSNVQEGNHPTSFIIGRATYWQIGQIHELWLKDHHNDAKIIRDLQNNTSIISLSYTPDMLVIGGKNNTSFKEGTLKILYSSDKSVWSILKSSVVDVSTRKVSAIDKIGGYYMIAASGYNQGAVNSSPPQILAAENNDNVNRVKKKRSPQRKSGSDGVSNPVSETTGIWKMLSSWLNSVIVMIK